MDKQYVLQRKDGEIAIITINRPEVRNALNAQVKLECLRAVQEVDADPEVRAVILTGAGDRAFAAGSDIAELQQRNTVSEVLPQASVNRALAHLLENMPKPTVAAINGFALGAGCELALACTFRIASESARLGLPEINLGIIPGNGGTQRLTRLVGKGRALQMVLTGEIVEAQEAYRMGLVSQVVPADKLLESALELARQLAGKPPLALLAAKQAINLGSEMGLATGIDYEAKLFAILCGTSDKTEGVSAFLEKRQAIFRGE